MRRTQKKVKKFLKKIDDSTRPYLFAGVFVVIAVLYLNTPWIVRTGTVVYENIAFALAPSAERAFEYGERHFDGQNVYHYDVRRAATFFYKAERLDPKLLYVHHELARVAFLHGDFGTAMTHINVQIALHGDNTPNSYYVRGLIEGYMGDYDSAAKDYEYFLKFDPRNWAGINDYAWVLLKAARYTEAAKATDEGLKYFPGNPWLLNSNSIALYELGRLKEADVQVKKAWTEVQKVQEPEWLHSYPGNDPAVAAQGIATFRKAVQENMHRIEAALASSTIQ